MFAVGCLLVIILPLLGVMAGLWFGGEAAAIWCALVGLALAIGVCGTAAYALVKARRP